MGQRPLQTKAAIPKLMLIAAGGHIIIVQLAPIVVLIAAVYWVGVLLFEEIETWRPETWERLARAGMLIGVSVVVVFILVAVKGCITERVRYRPQDYRTQGYRTPEEDRNNYEAWLKRAPARAIAEKEREQYEAALPAKRKREAEAALEALEAQRKSETVLQQEQSRKDAFKKEELAREQAQNDPTAVRLYVFRLKRANDGGAEAQYDLALQYLTGQGVARDLAAAKDWLQKAAAQGHKKAQKQLESLGATDAPASPK